MQGVHAAKAIEFDAKANAKNEVWIKFNTTKDSVVTVNTIKLKNSLKPDEKPDEKKGEEKKEGEENKGAAPNASNGGNLDGYNWG